MDKSAASKMGKYFFHLRKRTADCQILEPSYTTQAKDSVISVSNIQTSDLDDVLESAEADGSDPRSNRVEFRDEVAEHVYNDLIDKCS